MPGVCLRELCRDLCVGGVFVLIGVAAFGHSEPPPGPPVAPPPVVKAAGEWVEPARWSWLHWWEANRDPFLQAVRQGEPDQTAPEVIERYRRRAFDALMEATNSRYARGRTAAALALGRIGLPGAGEVLLDLAVNDSNETVRMAARVAMGLLDTPATREFLLGDNHHTAGETQAAIVGYGLVEQAEPRGIAALKRSLAGKAVRPATLAAWALRCQDGADGEKNLHGVLRRTKSPWLASEALLALGGAGGAASVEGLANTLCETPAGQTLPAWKELQDRHLKHKAFLSVAARRVAQYEQQYEQYVKDVADWAKNNPNTEAQVVEAKTLGTRKTTLGVEKIYQARLRASAAVALGRIDHPTASKALLTALDQKDDAYNNVWKGFVIMALGERGEAEALGRLRKILAGSTDRRVRMSTKQRKSPLRGYAALALGLYARPGESEQGPVNRPHYFKVCQLLAEKVADVKETAEVRSAAVLGLGLTGRTEVLKLLIPACRTIKTTDEPLIGYALLARAMVGDRNIIAPAKEFLALDADRDDTNGVLARRAAVLGIGVLGRQEGIPILVNSWELSYYVNRETAVAFALCGAYNTTDTFVEMLAEPGNDLAQAFAARCLGELFARRRPQHLGRLIRHSNYTMKNKAMQRFQRLGNECLFGYLIPIFGEAWR